MGPPEKFLAGIMTGQAVIGVLGWPGMSVADLR